MCKSNIQGEKGVNAVVLLETPGATEQLKASEITACRMPAVEHQPDLNWLIRLQVDLLDEYSANLIANTSSIHCESFTDTGHASYKFLDVEFLGARDNEVTFGATILSHSFKMLDAQGGR